MSVGLRRPLGYERARRRRSCSTDLIPFIFSLANGKDLLDPKMVPVMRMIRLIWIPIPSMDAAISWILDFWLSSTLAINSML